MQFQIRKVYKFASGNSIEKNSTLAIEFSFNGGSKSQFEMHREKW